jgi:hypothetical protein
MNRLRYEYPMIRKTVVSAAAILLVATAAVRAEDPPAKDAAPAADTNVAVELNKLEPSDKGCRAYVVVSNSSTQTFDTFKLDLVMFQKDGVIGRRFALDLAPVRPSKRTVKLFELDNTKCEDIGSFLVNDVMECRSDASAVTDCLARLKVTSLTKVEISK